jgi:hypothetical protein
MQGISIGGIVKNTLKINKEEMIVSKKCPVIKSLKKGVKTTEIVFILLLLQLLKTSSIRHLFMEMAI